MCGRFALKTPSKKLAKQFNTSNIIEWISHYNIAPTQKILTIVANNIKNDSNEMLLMRWGLIPKWSKKKKNQSELFNARSETLEEKPSFATPLKTQRCLIPTDGFYEWQKIGGKSTPYFFYLKELSPFAIAGLWDENIDGEGNHIISCTIITTAANDLIKPFHHRMPVIINPSHYNSWLDSSNDLEKANLLLKSFPAKMMDYHEVSSLVNNPQNNDERCIAKAGLF